MMRQKSMIPRRKSRSRSERACTISTNEMVDWDNRKAARDKKRRHVMSKSEFRRKMMNFFLNK